MARSQNKGAHRLPTAPSWQIIFILILQSVNSFKIQFPMKIKTLRDGANQKSPVSLTGFFYSAFSSEKKFFFKEYITIL
jgi:hypothetical protein